MTTFIIAVCAYTIGGVCGFILAALMAANGRDA